MENITLAMTNSRSQLYPKVWQLREDVLRVPLGMSLKNEDLSGDHEDQICVASKGDSVIACLMLKHVEHKTLKLRQMAVDPAYQGLGIGRQIMTYAEQYAVTNNYSKLTLHARCSATDFYQKLGYTVTSGVFEEVGIPHVAMEKELT